MQPHHFDQMNNGTAPRGYVALVSVLVVGAVGVAIASSLLLLGVSSSRTSFVALQSHQAKALANACAEDALQEIRDSSPFTGSGGFALGGGSCTFTVTNLGGQSREIEATGMVSSVVRRVNIFIDKINPDINVTSWQELASF